MKLLKPIKEAPKSRQGQWGHWGPVWQAIKTLKNGDWLPVEMGTEIEARKLASAARTHRTLKLNVRLEGSMVYLRERKQP